MSEAVNPTPNKFDLASLKLPQDFLIDYGTEKVHTVIPVGRPSKDTFIRIHPSEEYQITVGTIVVQGDRKETFILAPAAMGFVPELEKITHLRLAVDRQGNLYIIDVPAVDPSRSNHWTDSLLAAVGLAEKSWVRIAANMKANFYDVVKAPAIKDEPIWPQATFADLIEIAFRGKIIDSPDHIVLKKLMGLA
jgi:hypothetical protein